MMKNFEMVDGNNPEEVIMATQMSLIAGLRALIKDLESEKVQLERILKGGQP